MSLGPEIDHPRGEDDKDNFALWMVMIVTAVLMIMALYTSSIRTHEACLKTCEEAYKLNIDNSWHACEDRCNKKFGK
jgi:hypothetical protein